MATDPRYERAAAGNGGVPSDGRRSFEELAVAEDHEGWMSRSRVFLTPIAAPSIMGLFGFMIATLMLGAWQAGWYGDAATPLLIWPFALVPGGFAVVGRSPVSGPGTGSRWRCIPRGAVSGSAGASWNCW